MLQSKVPRLMLAAGLSGSGKTVITCGLLKALQNRGLKPSAFKCGPDYIDPMFHRQVLHAWGGNLDSFFMTEQDLQAQLVCGATDGDVAVIEGVMGYYDGLAGVSAMASSWDVAVKTQTPVILILDGRGASLSIAAVLKGFLSFRQNHQIVGVIINRVSQPVYDRLSPVLLEMGVIPLGYVPVCDQARLDSRHLGLLLPQEIENLDGQLHQLAGVLEKSLSIDLILSLAHQAPALSVKVPGRGKKTAKPLLVGVARDLAFCFYYQENMKLLQDLGVQLVPFSPLKDSQLPKGICGLILGGGYPENYAKELSDNTSMLSSVKQAVEGGLPLLAECGGFLYLHSLLQGSDQKDYAMVGLLNARAFSTNKLGRFGYVELTSSQEDGLLPKGQSVKGHEFHYWDSEKPGESWLASKPLSDRSWPCMEEREGCLWGFPHLYYASNPAFLQRWLTWCARYQEDHNDRT